MIDDIHGILLVGYYKLLFYLFCYETLRPQPELEHCSSFTNMHKYMYTPTSYAQIHKGMKPILSRSESITSLNSFTWLYKCAFMQIKAKSNL